MDITLDDLLQGISDVSDKIYSLTSHSEEFYSLGKNNFYRGQKQIEDALSNTLDETTHVCSCSTDNGIAHCRLLHAYILFREKFIALDSITLSEVLQPSVSIAVKQKIKRQLALSNRETLDLIDDVRSSGKWIFSYESYEQLLDKIIFIAPEFAGYIY